MNQELKASGDGLFGAKTTRRQFLRRSLALGAAAGAVSLLGSATIAAAAPAGSIAPGRFWRTIPGLDSADQAVQQAQRFRGQTLNVLWEAGLQAQDPLNYSGPKWEELTGVKINTIEVPYPDIFSKQVAEHVAGSGAYDVLQVQPSYKPDYLLQGMLEPLDGYIDQWMNKDDLNDYHPLYKQFMSIGGKTYGLFDDGDMILLYYRKDLFGNPDYQSEFKSRFGYDLAPPTTYQQYDDIQGFLTEKGNGQFWGGASQRAEGQVFFWFMAEFRVNHGKFFNPDTMDAQINSDAGIKTLTRMLNSNKTMPPGVEKWGFLEVLTAWMAGQLAMIGGTWPPIGRWSEGYGAGTVQLKFVPPSKVAGNVGYAIMPGGHSAHFAGWELGVSADSKNKELAYLFCQWANSPTISLERCMLPYALRDPFRLSHYSSPKYRSLWPYAGDYLDTLKAAADSAPLDPTLPRGAEYNDAGEKAVTAAQAGNSVEDALNTAAQAWNAATDRIGRDKQKQAYAEFAALPGAYQGM